MALSPSSCRGLGLLGCVLAGTAALLLPGCGDDSAATAGKAATTSPAATAASPKQRPAATCPAPVDAFVASLDALRRRLAVGLSYEQYAGRVKALTASYDRLPIDRLALDCLASAGTPAEAALNKYIDAANAWGECLADASCTTAAIEPVLQRKWRIASHSLSKAR
jgi:hypothetical protein